MKKVLSILFGTVSSFLLAQVEYPGAVTLGTSQIVFDYSTSACNTIDIPDVPARAFRDANGTINLIASHYTNWRMTGNDFNSLVKDCNPVMSSDQSTDPSTFNNNEWISSTYTLDGTTVYALIHNEYVPCGNWQNCWYNALTSAVSTDGGVTYTQAAAPSHLVAASPYQSPYPATHSPFGIFGGSNIIEKDGYYYKMVQLEAYQDQEWGAGLIRTNDLSDPASWRGWNGTDFSVDFVNPYTETGYDPLDKILAPVSRDQIGKMCTSLTYNTFFGKYMVVDYTVGEVNGVLKYGFYYALSDDLIHWSNKRLILQTTTSWSVGGSNYASIIDHNDTSRNFENAGQTCYLYYTKWNSGTYDRDLVRVPVTFSKEIVTSFVVNSTANGGDATPGDGLCKTTGNVCTLRAAIEEANKRPPYDNYYETAIPVTFTISGTGVKTITPSTYLPEIFYPLDINGYTQTGASVNTNDFDQGLNTSITVKIDAINTGTAALQFYCGGNTVRGLSIVNGNLEFILEEGYSTSSGGNKVEGCFIGINPDGTTQNDATLFFNKDGSGTIGGTTNAARNLIAGGIIIDSAENVLIMGNYIGTDKTGMLSSGTSAHGIQLQNGAKYTTIGGVEIEKRNVISGGNVGIFIDGETTAENFVEGNYIGVGVNGVTGVGNQRAGITITNGADHNSILNNIIADNSVDEAGIWIDNAHDNSIQSNFIGTDASETEQLGNGDIGTFSAGIMLMNASSGNQIGGNESEGNVIANNSFGIALYNNTGTGNSIRSNSIYANTEIGIDLGADYTNNDNDNQDSDGGPNNGQNFPVLSAANTNGTQISISGTLNSAPGQTFSIDFFANNDCDPSGYGEGKTFLGTTSVATNGSGTATIASTFTQVVSDGTYVTATATDANGNTSEFSACRQVTAANIPSVSTNNSTICEGNSTTLTAVPSEEGGTYLWNTGATTSSITVNPAVTTTYSVVYTLNGVSSQSSMSTVTVNPVPELTVVSDTVCPGAQSMLVAVPDLPGGTFLWGNNATNDTIFVTNENSMNVSYTLNGCTSTTETVTVQYHSVPETPVITVNSAMDSLFCSQEGVSYQWYLEGEAIAGATMIYYFADHTYGTYSVEVFNEFGCSAESNLFVYVLENVKVLKLERMNVFPNPNDGTFTIQFDNKKERTIEIYDAVGKLLYVQSISSISEKIALNLSKGLYTIKIKGFDLNYSMIVN